MGSKRPRDASPATTRRASLINVMTGDERVTIAIDERPFCNFLPGVRYRHVREQRADPVERARGPRAQWPGQLWRDRGQHFGDWTSPMTSSQVGWSRSASSCGRWAIARRTQGPERSQSWLAESRDAFNTDSVSSWRTNCTAPFATTCQPTPRYWTAANAWPAGCSVPTLARFEWCTPTGLLRWGTYCGRHGWRGMAGPGVGQPKT